MALGPTQLPIGRGSSPTELTGMWGWILLRSPHQGLLPTELTGMWGWILLRSPHRGRRSPPAPAPMKQRPGPDMAWAK